MKVFTKYSKDANSDKDIKKCQPTTLKIKVK